MLGYTSVTMLQAGVGKEPMLQELEVGLEWRMGVDVDA